MRILNLYANIGGNRKFWDGHEITAVEIDPKIAAIYQDLWPDDTVVVGDAHQYLLEHYEEFDFIWSSPPCPTHSQWGRLRMLPGPNKTPERKSDVRYPDMTLYQEIILLEHFFKGKYCVENVVGYYEPLIPPTELGGHYFWTNFYLPILETEGRGMGLHEDLQERSKALGFDLSKYKGIDKRLALRDVTEPELGAHILKASQTEDMTSLFPTTTLIKGD